MKEALKLALEALEGYESCIDGYYAGAVCPQIDKAITAIKEALSSPNGKAQSEQEPVAWHEGESIYWHTDNGLNDWIRANGTPLYTTPPQRTWVGLTDEQVEAIAEEFGVGGWICDFARAIEAELKEKNDC